MKRRNKIIYKECLLIEESLIIKAHVVGHVSYFTSSLYLTLRDEPRHLSLILCQTDLNFVVCQMVQ